MKMFFWREGDIVGAVEMPLSAPAGEDPVSRPGFGMRGILQEIIGPFVLLDERTTVCAASDEGVRLCELWRLGSEDRTPVFLRRPPIVPGDLLAVCREKLLAKSWDRTSISHVGRLDWSADVELVSQGGGMAPQILIRFRRDRQHEADRPNGPLAELTPKEREVAMLVAAGLSNKEIARQLDKSLPTVKMQLQSIFRKFNVANRTQLAGTLATPLAA